MNINVDVDTLSQMDRFRMYCYLKQQFERRKAVVLEESLEAHYPCLSVKAVSLLQAMNLKLVRDLVIVDRKALVSHRLASRGIIEELEMFLDCYGWELSKY